VKGKQGVKAHSGRTDTGIYTDGRGYHIKNGKRGARSGVDGFRQGDHPSCNETVRGELPKHLLGGEKKKLRVGDSKKELSGTPITKSATCLKEGRNSRNLDGNRTGGGRKRRTRKNEAESTSDLLHTGRIPPLPEGGGRPQKAEMDLGGRDTNARGVCR